MEKDFGEVGGAMEGTNRKSEVTAAENAICIAMRKNGNLKMYQENSICTAAAVR